MTDDEIAAIRFTDGLTTEEAFANVRIMRDCIGLTLSLLHDGDVEVCLRVEDCEALVAALQRALTELGRQR